MKALVAVTAAMVVLLAAPLGSASADSGRDRRFGIAEAYKSALSRETGIGWERIILSWDAIQPGGPGDWRADFVFPPELLQRELAAGIQVVGLLQFTPGWARSDPAHGPFQSP